MRPESLNDQKSEAKPLSLRRAYFELGRSLMESSHWEKACRQFLSALEENDENPADWSVYNLLAQSFKRAGNSSSARMYLLQAIATAPPEISKKLATESELTFNEIEVSNVDGFDPVLILMGEAEWYHSQHDLVRAKENMEKALTLMKEKPGGVRETMGKLSLATILYEAGKFDESLKYLQEISDINDQNTRTAVMLLKGKCLLAKQQYPEALQVSEQLISSSYYEGYILNMQVNIYQMKYNEALETVHNAIILYPSQEDLQYYKMQILVESNFNIDEGYTLFNQLIAVRGEKFILDKLNDHYLRFRSHHGNDNFFLSQVYYWMPNHFTATAALEQADKAIAEGVSFRDYDYPQGIVYRLKARIYDFNNDATNAAEFYSSAGKEFYWNRQYAIAQDLFKKAVELNKNHIEAYRYYADNQLLLSYVQEFPYVDKKFLDEADQIWEKAYALQLPTLADAWTYLTKARILEQQSNLVGVDKSSNYQHAWMNVEKNLLLSGQGYFALTCLSKILREIDGMERCSYAAAKKAEELSENNVNVWEAITAISLNIGRWDDGLEALARIRKTYPDDITYMGWEGFAQYGKRDYEKAVELFSDVVTKDPSWAWSRHLKMICNWMLNRNEEQQEDIQYFLSKEKYYIENKSFLEVAFAYYIAGNATRAYVICEDAPDSKEFEKNKQFYQCLFAVGMNDFTKAEHHLDKYFPLTKVERDISELESFLARGYPEKILFQDKFHKKHEEIKEGLISTPLQEMEVLETNTKEYRDSSSAAWLALHLNRFRILLDEKNWVKAGQEALQVNKLRQDYKDAYLMYDRFLISLQSWLFNLLKNDEKFEQWELLETALDENQQSFISYPDTWFIASLLAKSRGKTDLASRFDQKARDFYNRINQSDMEKNMRRLQELYPELSNYLSKEDSDTVSKMAVCKSCGALITSPRQRFCYKCGNSL